MRKEKIVLSSLLIFFLFLFGFLLTKISAGKMQRIGSAKIDVHGICKNVVNSGNKEVMVPFNTKEEWCSFIKNPPSNVSLTTCQNCYWSWCSNGEGSWVCNPYNVGTCP